VGFPFSIVRARVNSFCRGGVGRAFYATETLRLTPAAINSRVVSKIEQMLTEMAARRAEQALKKTTKREVPLGVYLGAGGAGYVEILLGDVAGRDEIRVRGIARMKETFEALMARDQVETELFAGTAGYVAAITDLESRGLFERGLCAIKMRAVETLVRKYDTRMPIIHQHLGAAHGATGELIALLLEPAALGEARLHALLMEHLSLATIDGEFIAWPSQSGGEVPSSLWPSFCNGIAGQAILYAAAAAHFGDASFVRAAVLSGNTCFRLQTANASLCCGLAGMAAALGHCEATLKRPNDRRRVQTRVTQLQQNLDGPLEFLQGRLGLEWTALVRAQEKKVHYPLLRALVHRQRTRSQR
jgi:Lanthionine synthetase C-like protein